MARGKVLWIPVFWELVLSSVCWAWKHTQRIPALRRLRHQDGQELETNMGHRVRPTTIIATNTMVRLKG